MKHTTAIVTLCVLTACATPDSPAARKPTVGGSEYSVFCEGRLDDLKECKQSAKMICRSGYKVIHFDKRVFRAKGPQYKAQLTFSCN